MYSGWLLTNYSGQIIGAHQKFNRVAYRQLKLLQPELQLPALKLIQHFEGRNGPDGLKLKSPGHNEPHHFYDPFDPDYTDLLKQIESHYQELVTALVADNQERAAYEAAWLAHAVTDGLTPAHHYPYQQQVGNLRDNHQPKNVSQKLVFKGDGLKQTINRNWSFWGARGLILTHGLFELGVAMIIKPLKLTKAQPSHYDLKLVQEVGLIEVFKRQAREIALYDMYNRFSARGWSRKLAAEVRQVLAPAITRMITLAWYQAIQQALETKKWEL